MRKNLFLTFCFSFIPGAGQMYQTYMKRGLSIMSLAGLVFWLAFTFDSALFIIPGVIIFAYSFFDTYNLRNMNDQTRAEYKDDYIWNNLSGVKTFDKINGNKKLIGIVLIILGVYFIGLEILRGLLLDDYAYDIIYAIYDFYRNEIPAILVAIACIFGGYKIIK